MISSLKNQEGLVYAFIEWIIVDKNGKHDAGGKYVYIEDHWIHPNLRFSESFKELVRLIKDHPYSKGTEKVYWDFYRDQDRKKIVESEERPWMHRHQSKTYDKDYILKKILGKDYKDENAHMQV